MAETNRRPTVMSKIQRACSSISDAKIQTSSIEFVATPTAPGPVSRLGFIIQHDERGIVMRTKLKAGSSKVSVVSYKPEEVLLVIGRAGGFGQVYVVGQVPLGVFKGLASSSKGLAQFSNSEDKYTLYVGAGATANAVAEDVAGKKAKAAAKSKAKVPAKKAKTKAKGKKRAA